VKTVVITGSTRGLGYGLAQAFLELGCAVVLSGRTQEAVDRAGRALVEAQPGGAVGGLACDVRRPEQVQALWDAAVAQFGRVDIWINNAGIGLRMAPVWEHDPDALRAVVETNLLGALYGARVAVRGMLAQGGGAIYNVEGLGSGGRRVAGLAVYGCTKSALQYLTDSLVDETRGTPIIVGAFRPGMVVTGLLEPQMAGPAEDWQRTRRIFNILGDRVETVAPWLARRALANTRTGARLTWITRRRAFGRFLLAPFQKRDLGIPEEPPAGNG
jgi:NAD(P)-dependent dehydrogenase (short-subunit alcohol dehydrogenase family)